MLPALIDRFDSTAAGCEEEAVLPAVEVPVLLLQANQSSGGLMTDDQVARAFPSVVPTAAREVGGPEPRFSE